MDKTMPIESLWDAVERRLVAAKREVTDEIRSYPQPIAGCDAQIPALWERRDGLVAELERLAKVRATGTGEALDAFLAASPFIDAQTAHDIEADVLAVKSAAE